MKDWLNKTIIKRKEWKRAQELEEEEGGQFDVRVGRKLSKERETGGGEWERRRKLRSRQMEGMGGSEF